MELGRAVALLVCCLPLAALTTGASGQLYPGRPIQFIVPFAPGGAGDFVGRLIGQQLSEQLGQPVVIDNRTGAGGALGTDLAAKAAPNGYTLLLGQTGPLAINPTMNPNTPYDPLRDLAPVTMVASFPNVLIVHPSLPARSVQELVALAKARPGQLNYSSTGIGSSVHLAAEMFKTMAGINAVHVPYKGSAAAVTGVVSGEVAFYFGTVSSSLPLARARRVRALAVTGLTRSPAAPELPTVAESGLPGFEISSWYGLLVPAGTPREIVGRLHVETLKALATPGVKKRLAQEGSEPISGNTPGEFTEWIRSEIGRWAKVITLLKAKSE